MVPDSRHRDKSKPLVGESEAFIIVQTTPRHGRGFHPPRRRRHDDNDDGIVTHKTSPIFRSLTMTPSSSKNSAQISSILGVPATALSPILQAQSRRNSGKV